LIFEFASFTVREGEEDSLVAERPAMIAALKQAFPGLLAAWLTRQDDGTWVDAILWETRTAAEDAAARVNDVAEARQWFSHIASSLGLRHAEVHHAEIVDAAALKYG
jgi:hypothetical protein